MRILFGVGFEKDLRTLDSGVRRRIAVKVAEVREASSFLEIQHLKKLQGEGSYYRLRVGDYRIGLGIENDTVTFMRCLHRREIYRFFP